MASETPYSAQNVLKFLNDNFGLLLLGASLFLAGFVAGSLWKENQVLSKGGALNPSQQVAQQQPEALPLSDADWQEVQKDGVFTLGDEDADVTMVEFTDYQCPFCGQHFTQTHSQLVDTYVKTGKLKIVFRDQALSFHPNANSAAQAVRCAVEQKGGEAMHDALFENQQAWSDLTGDEVLAKYAELANAANLNGSQISSCVESAKYKQAVDADGVLGQRVGAGGTPTFFIEGKPLVGAQPFASFQAAIDAELAE